MGAVQGWGGGSSGFITTKSLMEKYLLCGIKITHFVADLEKCRKHVFLGYTQILTKLHCVCVCVGVGVANRYYII